MTVNSKVLDDLVRVASGAVGTVIGLRDEAGQQMRERFDRVLAKSDMVSREEFEVVREMAAKARAEQETLAERLALLEEKLAQSTAKTTSKPATSRRATKTAPTRRRVSKKAESK
ncbi:MAG: accessory factor UbiK family protein [Pseudomonadota bacterium]